MPLHQYDTNNGQYSQFTEEELQEYFLIMLDNYRGSIVKTCKVTKVPRSLYDKWMLVDEFRDCVLIIKEQVIDLLEDTLIDVAVADRNVQAIKYYMDNQARHRGYGQGHTNKLEVSGPGGGAIPIGHYPPQPKTLEEWQAQVVSAQKARDNDNSHGQKPSSPSKNHAKSHQLALPAPGQTVRNNDQ